MNLSDLEHLGRDEIEALIREEFGEVEQGPVLLDPPDWVTDPIDLDDSDRVLTYIFSDAGDLRALVDVTRGHADRWETQHRTELFLIDPEEGVVESG